MFGRRADQPRQPVGFDFGDFDVVVRGVGGEVACACIAP